MKTKIVYYSKMVIAIGSGSKEHKPPTLEDLCEDHKWRHSKRLPKDWVYCPKCKT